MKNIRYDDIFPIKVIENRLLIRRSGDITAGITLLKPEVFTLSVQDATDACCALKNILRMLPNGAVFHMQDLFYLHHYKAPFDESDSYIKRSNLRYYNQRPLLGHYSRLYITLTVNDEKIDRFPQECSFCKASDWVVKKPFTRLQKSLSEIDTLVDTVISKFNNIKGWHAARMDDRQLGCSLYDYCNLSFDNPSEQFQDKMLQPMAYDLKTTVYGNKSIKILSLCEEGDRLYALTRSKTAPASSYHGGVHYNQEIHLKTSTVFPIGLGLPVNHILNTIIQKFDNETFIRFLDRRRQSLNLGITLRNRESMNVQATIEDFTQGMIEQGLEGCIAKVNVIVFDSDNQRLMQTVGLCESAFLNMMGAKCNVEIAADVPALFFACAPGNGIENYRYFLTTSQQAVNYIHKESNYISDPSGHVFVDRFGSPVVVNMWDSPLTVNRNKIIIGPSGTGKSFLINGLTWQSYSQGNDIIKIDIGGSYKRTCQFLGGRYFDAADIGSFSFNPFLCETDQSGRYLYRSLDDQEEGEDEFVNQLVQILSHLWKGNATLSPEQDAILKDMVVNFYLHVNKNGVFPCATQFYEYTKIYEDSVIQPRQKKYLDFESLRLILHPYAYGQYRFLLNAQRSIDILSDRYIVFDLEGIKNNQALTNIVALLIIQLCINKIKKRKGVKKTLIIDEATDFLSHQKMGDFIAYLYRTIRKKQGEVYLALQNVQFFDLCAEGIRDSILINSDTRILLSHRNFTSSYRDLIRHGLITEYEAEILDSVEEKEFFLKMGSKSAVYKHDVSKQVEYIFTSKQEEILHLEKLRQSCGSLIAAIEQMTLEGEMENS